MLQILTYDLNTLVHGVMIIAYQSHLLKSYLNVILTYKLYDSK
jgi:hypothetical protein